MAIPLHLKAEVKRLDQENQELQNQQHELTLNIECSTLTDQSIDRSIDRSSKLSLLCPRALDPVARHMTKKCSAHLVRAC